MFTQVKPLQLTSTQLIDQALEDAKEELKHVKSKITALKEGTLSIKFLYIKDTLLTTDSLLKFFNDNIKKIDYKGSLQASPRYIIFKFTFNDNSEINIKGNQLTNKFFLTIIKDLK